MVIPHAVNVLMKVRVLPRLLAVSLNALPATTSFMKLIYGGRSSVPVKRGRVQGLRTAQPTNTGRAMRPGERSPKGPKGPTGKHESQLSTNGGVRRTGVARPRDPALRPERWYSH
jgi:hypothetical protein